MSSLFERYVQGDRVGVWTEIVGLGGDIRLDHQLLVDVERVGRETMRRARRNVERLVSGLPATGYIFDPGPDLDTFVPPELGVAERIDELEQRMGSMPLAFRWWLEEVGTVNLMGIDPGWTVEYLDPLVVEAPPAYIAGELDAWEADLGADWERPHFTIDFSPDRLHKANVSGGAPYALAVPNSGADGLVLWERHQTTFTNHVRIAFGRGGFLGLDPTSWPDGAPHGLAQLAATLELI